MHAPARRKLLFVQFGDFREAALRLRETGVETYNSQRYSVSYVEALAERYSVTVLAMAAPAAYDEVLPGGIRCVGLAGPYRGTDSAGRLVAAVEAIDPDWVILRTPDIAILDYCRRRGIRVLPCLADTPNPRSGLRGIVDRFRFRRLARLLGDRAIPWITNHNTPACRALARIGVSPAKIVPWDWPTDFHPAERAPRSMPAGDPVRLLCLGAVNEAKGVGDAIRALAAAPTLRARCRISVVGRGDLAGMQTLAATLGVADRVDFVGPVPFAEVMPAMDRHDVLLVLSRSSYGEGMPGTIYQGLAARLPIVMSRHPVFVETFSDGEDSVFAASGEPTDVAAAIERVLDTPGLYARLSANAEAAFAKVALPVHWADVIEHWLRDDAAGNSWLAARSLATYPSASAAMAGPRQ